MRNIILFLCAMMSWALASVASAGAYRISPLKVEFSPRNTENEVNLKNLSDEAISVEIQVMRWQQKDDKTESYEPTQDIVFAPPLVNIPAKKTKTIRFRLRKKTIGETEQAYRIYFQELPKATVTTGAGVNFGLRFGVPVFFNNGKKTPTLIEGSYQLVQAGDTTPETRMMNLTLKNNGKKFFKVLGIELYPIKKREESKEVAELGEKLGSAERTIADTSYVLPNAIQTWQIKLADNLPAGDYVAIAKLDDSDYVQKPYGIQGAHLVFVRVP